MIYSIPYHTNNAVINIAQALTTLSIPNDKKIAILCIGTDTSTGDSFGPLVGSYAKQKSLENIVVFGTLDNPVHALNLREYIEYIKERFNYIFALDSALSSPEGIGKIQIKQGLIRPGAGIGRELPSVGDIGILGFVGAVGTSYRDSSEVLRSIRLNHVIKMAQITSQALVKVDNFLSMTKSNTFSQNRLLEGIISKPKLTLLKRK